MKIKWAMDSRTKAIEAARTMLIQKGKAGVRMQEIADAAGINKGLLHYYFRTKDNLFEEVFRAEFIAFYGGISDILDGEGGMEEKLSAIIDHLFEMNIRDEGYSSFISSEMSRNRKMSKSLESEIQFADAVKKLNKLFKETGILSDPQFALQVMLNIISLCSHPFSMKPLISKVNGKGKWKAFLKERKEFLKTIIIGSFRP